MVRKKKNQQEEALKEFDRLTKGYLPLYQDGDSYKTNTSYTLKNVEKDKNFLPREEAVNKSKYGYGAIMKHDLVVLDIDDMEHAKVILKII